MAASPCARGGSRTLSRACHEELRPYGIGVAQMKLLVALGTTGELAPSQIGAVLDIEKSTLSRTLRRLEDDGFIETSVRLS